MQAHSNYLICMRFNYGKVALKCYICTLPILEHNYTSYFWMSFKYNCRTVMLLSPSISPPQRLVQEPSLMDCTSNLVLSLFALVMLVRPNSSVTPVS